MKVQKTYCAGTRLNGSHNICVCVLFKPINNIIHARVPHTHLIDLISMRNPFGTSFMNYTQYTHDSALIIIRCCDIVAITAIVRINDS